MSQGEVLFTCHGCGAVVDAARALPFRCPRAGGDDADHVLQPLSPTGSTASAPSEPPRSPLPAPARDERGQASLRGAREIKGEPGARLVTSLSHVVGEGRGEGGRNLGDDDPNPFIRYRALLSPYRLARAAGLSDAAWVEMVGTLDDALARADGRGFRVTPLAQEPELARALGVRGELWVKDETGNVSGSHKARHLMGVMLYLRALEEARLPAGEGLRRRRLAIASCGNAALAAAVVARAADWPLDVFIPPDASQAVVRRLGDLGARIAVCERRPGEAGDPCFLRFREAVSAGALPFGVQGTENGLAVEGGRTLAFEMAEGLAAAGAAPDVLLAQVGGGALASALAQGFAMAAELGVLPRPPRLVAVQTAQCPPLARAWGRLEGVALADAARARSRFMWPWESAGRSLAHGILDDETYDWWAIAEGMRATGGAPIVVDEEALARAHDLSRQHTGIAASHTGTAGLAALLAGAPGEGRIATVLSGVER